MHKMKTVAVMIAIRAPIVTHAAMIVVPCFDLGPELALGLETALVAEPTLAVELTLELAGIWVELLVVELRSSQPTLEEPIALAIKVVFPNCLVLQG